MKSICLLMFLRSGDFYLFLSLSPPSPTKAILPTWYVNVKLLKSTVECNGSFYGCPALYYTAPRGESIFSPAALLDKIGASQSAGVVVSSSFFQLQVDFIGLSLPFEQRYRSSDTASGYV